MDGLSAIVLAAGYSSRMGAFKPLLELRGRSFLARAVGAFAAVGIGDIVVVTGHRGDEVSVAAQALDARPVANPRYDAGMYTSVQAGVSAVGAGRAFFLLPVDCPLVRAETIGRLARSAATAGADVVVPVHHGVRGHPPLLAPALRDEILTAEPPGGLRDLLESRRGRTLEVAVPDPGATLDADTRAELTALNVAAAEEDLPSESRCLELLREHGAPDALVAHSVAVASVAAALVTALNERQQYLCVPLVVAGALLHDIARSRPHHAEAGARALQRLGYARVVRLVRHHMRLGEASADEFDETQVVYLADKVVQGDRLVGLDERFAARLKRIAADPAAREGVVVRREEARAVLARVEAILGRRLGGMTGG